ncbi:MAG: hypothetical protein OXI53_12650 [Nitrospira sp.]|nr:hypothetical protein [Nitrospira sp.]
MSTNEWLTIIAIITGPIVAVSITLWRDRRNEVRRRRTEILASLMRTRAVRLSGEHVGVLHSGTSANPAGCARCCVCS